MKRLSIRQKKYLTLLTLFTIVAIILFIAVKYVTQSKNEPRYVGSDKPAISSMKSSTIPTDNNYSIHKSIIATVFWVGEDGDESNDFIQNRSSLWMDDWLNAYGGVDSPDKRCDDYKPCGFTPKENPFYFALPYADTTENGQKSEKELRRIPWYDGTFPDSGTLLKNRWVKIEKDGKTAYAQWEDVGPFGEDDIEYVFGAAEPKELRAGIDLSPATADYLAVDGRGKVSWQFIEESDVPAGPWKQTITTSPPLYN